MRAQGYPNIIRSISLHRSFVLCQGSFAEMLLLFHRTNDYFDYFQGDSLRIMFPEWTLGAVQRQTLQNIFLMLMLY